MRTSAATLYNRSSRTTLEATVAAAEAELRACRQENLAVASGWDVASPSRPRGPRAHNRSSFSRGIGRSEVTVRKMHRFRALVNTRAASLKAGGQVCAHMIDLLLSPKERRYLVSLSTSYFVYFFISLSLSLSHIIDSTFFLSYYTPLKKKGVYSLKSLNPC